MKQYKKLAHALWQCKYHVVWCPKYRFRILRGEIGKSVRDIIRQLCEWRRIEILSEKPREGSGHGNLLISKD